MAALFLPFFFLCSCTEDDFSGEIGRGEPVQFTTFVPNEGPRTRTAKEDWTTKVQSYTAVQEGYTFDIEMWKKGAASASYTATYVPTTSTDDEGSTTYASDGTLQNVNGRPLYWQDNVNSWGFRAIAGTANLEADQTTKAKWLAQDRLEGYSYLPIWEDEEGQATDDFDQINYRTSRQWYADNKKALALSGIMADPTSEEYKKVPLFLQHKRAWLTVILKAGEGVTREALAFKTAATNIRTTLYSYKDGEEEKAIEAWPREELIDYDADKNGEAQTGVSTTRYDAIVEPHNFIKDASSRENDVIARINVSNQNFSFAAANDYQYSTAMSESDIATALKAYNLEAGKHLTIVATLSRASRIIKITAWIEDWTETVTQTICDDYGQNGDPVLIHDRKELADFLADPEKNKAGNVGYIVPNILTLTKRAKDDDDDTWDDSYLQDWDGSSYTLYATLNLAGAQLETSTQLLGSIDRTGNLINGEIRVTDSFNAPSAIANSNSGTLERISVTTPSETSSARASVAGLIAANSGTIFHCSSSLSVYGTTAGYVGGIAGTSLNNTPGVIATIDGCTVSARVDGNGAVTAGGGIVGQADGRLSNNTFDYGITLLQDHKFWNIIAAIGNTGLTTHSNNSWPTTPNYTVNGTADVVITNNRVGTRYDHVIDNILELKEVLNSTHNQDGKHYRVANSFTVDKENWIWGTDILKSEYFNSAEKEGHCRGTVRFKLNGNGKTITLTGATNATMLFGNIIGEVYDLNLLLDKPIVADRIMDINNSELDTNSDAIAALAYSVTEVGHIHDITLRAGAGTYIQSSTPGGIAVWASHGARMTGCASDVAVRMNVTNTGSDVRRYAGGIVACAEEATISQCRYYNSHSNAIAWAVDKAKTSNCYYGGIVGGTSEIATSHTVPKLKLTECYSWWQLPTFAPEETPRPTMGSLIGSTIYQVAGTQVHNAMDDHNEGNWWYGTIGAGKMADGVNEEKAIGKKNAIVPTIPKEFL